MTRLEKIEREIAALSAAEREDLRTWFIAFDAEAWDRAIERDAASGALDAMADEALTEHRVGRTRAL